MSEPRAKRPRVTPRNSSTNENSPDNETPYSNLRQLAGLIRQKPATPLRRPQNVIPSSAAKVTKKTPTALSRTPASQQRDRSRREAPTTPHAIRAFERHRHALATTGDRRRSGRLQRETPRDILRPLSKLLARSTKAIDSSPQVEPTKHSRVGDDWVDEPDAPAPRLSMPLDELEDDDSFHIDPPTMSIHFEDDENVTARSFEGPRRALAEMGNSRLSRGSLGSIRASDQFGDLKSMIDVTDLEENLGVGGENTGTVTRFGLEDGNLTLNAGENTQEMRAFLNAASRRQSRFSDLHPLEAEDEEPDPTFHFQLPEVREEDVAAKSSSIAEDLFVAENSPDAESPPAANSPPVAESPPVTDSAGENELAADSDSEGEAEPQEYSDEEALPVVDESSVLGNSLAVASMAEQAAKPARKPRKREFKVSRNGTEYPSLPSTVIKRVASSCGRTNGGGTTNISRETLSALSQATEWFFEQVSDDLASYSEHAGRKTIDETDVITLMRRQRVLNSNTTPFSLAQKHLPRELLQAVRFGAPVKSKQRKRRRLSMVREENEEQ